MCVPVRALVLSISLNALVEAKKRKVEESTTKVCHIFVLGFARHEILVSSFVLSYHIFIFFCSSVLLSCSPRKAKVRVKSPGNLSLHQKTKSASWKESGFVIYDCWEAVC